MPLIARHHAEDLWRPVQSWGDTVHVQWGDHGLVMVDGGKSYGTAFFEAFPKDGSSSFIRGEGADVEAAEAKAFAAWKRQHGCHASGGHRWTRSRRYGAGKFETYTNGGCFCLKCGAFATVMLPVVKLGSWREPLSVGELSAIAAGACRVSPWSGNAPKDRKWRRGMELRARASGIQLPPVQPRDPSLGPFSSDEYTEGCRRAVGEFCRANIERLADGKEDDGIIGFLDEMAIQGLRRLAESA